MATDSPNEPDLALEEHLQRKVHWKTVGLRLLVGLCVLTAVAWFGRHAGEEIKAMESWIAGHGVWGWVVFVGMLIVFTSMFVPDTVLAVAAGVLFGLAWGTVLTVVGALITAALNFLAAHRLLRPRIEKMLEQHPKLRDSACGHSRRAAAATVVAAVTYQPGVSQLRFGSVGRAVFDVHDRDHRTDPRVVL